MKKIFSLLLILFLSLGLVGCGDGQQTDDPTPDNGETDKEDDKVEVDFDKEIAKVVIPEKITSSIELPLELANGEIEVYWESSNTNVISNDGCFFMPEIDTELTLKATYYYNGEIKETGASIW